MRDKLKIAMIGTKGIPAKWGGIEVYVQEIAERLAERGHIVAAYSRRWFTGSSRKYKGVRIVITPTIRKKATDALLHGVTSSIHAAVSGFDIVHYHGLGSYFSAMFPRISGAKVVITVHADAWVEPKWSPLAVATLKAAVNTGMRVAHEVATVSPVLQELLGSINKRRVILTPPGVAIGVYKKPATIVKDYGLEANKYVLFIGRLDSVKRVEVLIKAFKSLRPASMKLVITGDSGPSDGAEYKNQLIEVAGNDPQVIFTGFHAGNVKEELLSNCFMFVLPSINEGVPIALLEAMSYGRPCLASDIPPHRWVISDGSNGFLASTDSGNNFQEKLALILSMEDKRLADIGSNAREFVRSHFNWDNTVDLLEQSYFGLLS